MKTMGEWLRESQHLSAAAEQAMTVDGNADLCRELYEQAADAAGMAFHLSDKTKLKTFNMLAAHWVALLQRAGRFSDAGLACLTFMNDERIFDWTRRAIAVNHGLVRWRISGPPSRQIEGLVDMQDGGDQ